MTNKPIVKIVGKATHTNRKQEQLILDIDYCCPTLMAGFGGGNTPKIIEYGNKSKDKRTRSHNEE